MSDLILIQKYEVFLKYIDPILQNMPVKRANLKNNTENLFLKQVDLLYLAVVSGTPSRLNDADSGLAGIRFRLRFLRSIKHRNTIIKVVDGVVKKTTKSGFLVSRKSTVHAEILLSEVGSIIGKMKKGK